MRESHRFFIQRESSSEEKVQNRIVRPLSDMHEGVEERSHYIKRPTRMIIAKMNNKNSEFRNQSSRSSCLDGKEAHCSD